MNYDNNYSAEGINPNRGLDDYFLFFAQGKRLDEISQFSDENFNQAYTNIGKQTTWVMLLSRPYLAMKVCDQSYPNRRFK